MRILIETTLHHLIYHNYIPTTEVILDDFGAEKTLHHPTYLKYTPISEVVLGRLANSYSSVGLISGAGVPPFTVWATRRRMYKLQDRSLFEQ